MLNLKINGVDMSDKDINLLICNEPAKNILEIMFFTDEGEVKNNILNADIDIKYQPEENSDILKFI